MILVYRVQHQDRELTATVKGQRIYFEGGKDGSHSLDMSLSCPMRVAAHWMGYCQNSGAKAQSAEVFNTIQRRTGVPSSIACMELDCGIVSYQFGKWWELLGQDRWIPIDGRTVYASARRADSLENYRAHTQNEEG